MAYQSETAKYAAEAQAYLQQVHTAKESGRFDKPIKLVDPRAARFSPAAETQRQAKAVDSANASETGLALPESVDLGEGATTPLPDSIDLTEGDSVRSEGTGKKPFHPGQILDTLLTPVDPTLSHDLIGDAPKEYTGSDPIAKIGYGLAEIGHNVLETGINTALTPFTYLAGQLPVRTPKPTIAPPMPKVISPIELDTLVAERTAQGPIQTGAFPDIQGMPAKTVETGNTIVAPSLEPGFHTQQGNADKYLRGSTFDPTLEGQPGGGILRDAKGNKKTRPLNPATAQPGEYGTGDQLDLLGGYNVRGEADFLNKKYVLKPGEDMNIGMDVLRGQRLLLPDIPAEYAETITKPIAKALKTRVLTPEMEQSMKTISPSEQGAYPIQVKMSVSGKSASAGPLEDSSFVIPKEFTVDNTANGAVFPSLYSRVIRADVDAMKQIGPVGDGASALINTAYNNRAVGTSKDMVNVVEQLDQILGTRGFMERKVKGAQQLMAGENPFIYGMNRQWNLSDAEQESLFNYMYTKRQMAPLNDRVRQAGETLFEHGLYPASSDPGVRMLTVKNPFTGKDIPLGEPGMFMPQQPINPITHKAISDTQWGLLYERRGGEKLGITKEQFKDLVVKLSQHDPEVSSFKMKGLENMRLLDLDALGGSPYQWAKKLGYETDPFRATFRFNSLARLRGQFEQIREPLNGLIESIPGDQAEAKAWLKKSANRALLNDGSYDLLENQTRFTRAMSRVADVTMLQMGALGNFTQIIYPIARGGLSASSKGLWSMLTGVDRKIVENSGSLFPAMLNDLTVPSGALARLDSAVFKMYGLSNMDRFTRYFAGHIGHEYVKGLEQSLLANPSNKKIQSMIAELGGDAKALLQTGTLDDNTRYKMIQQFSNNTAGVTDVRGVPLYATNENPWFRLINKYKTFAQANTAEVDRLIRQSPDGLTAVKRFVTLIAGAEVVGGTVNVARQGLQDALLGNEKNPSKTWARFAMENVILGLGTIPGLLMVQALNTPEAVMIGLTGGPAAGLAGSLIQDLSSTVKHGIGWRSMDTLSKRLPLVGPITGPLVQQEVRRETKREAAKTRSLQEDTD